MKTFTLLLVTLLSVSYAFSQRDWDEFAIPAEAGSGKSWSLQEAPSDEFNYTFNETTSRADFGPNGEKKWYNFYHNGWDGPGTTYWKYNHVSVDGNALAIRSSRWTYSSDGQPISQYKGLSGKMGKTNEGVNAGCITSYNRVKYPVYVEAAVSVADITLASDVWMLSPDDTQEIDIIECYGGGYSSNSYFAKYIHVSHHSFIRSPFTDYQPKDRNSWWERSDVTAIGTWGKYCWNGGDRKYVRVGVNWISPFHFEYYVDGEMVRVLYYNAFATKVKGTWNYTYPTTNVTVTPAGYQPVEAHSTSGTVFDLDKLKAASAASSYSTIDPGNFQKGFGFTKELDIIINVESQDWHVTAGRTPDDADLENPERNTMLVDWIRVYKPITGNNVNEMTAENIDIVPNPFNDVIEISSEDAIKQISIHQMDGGVVKLLEVGTTEKSINTSNLPAGMYIINVLTWDGKYISQKLVKE